MTGAIQRVKGLLNGLRATLAQIPYITPLGRLEKTSRPMNSSIHWIAFASSIPVLQLIFPILFARFGTRLSR
jgi:hypothetical protein